MALPLKRVERPRELKWYQASSMLYGDWGTSKAYVLGIAFAIAGHASLFFLLAMNVLVMIVGYCYVVICKAYPDGGGVYSSARLRNRTLAVIGALLLIADYVVTASLSGLDAFHYFGLSHPHLWTIAALVLIGLVNIVGPTKSGNAASFIAVLVFVGLAVLSVLVIPFIGQVKIVVPQGTPLQNWVIFVGIVLALSGVETIANITGIMVEPVKKTAKKAIIPVLIEVTVITLILGAAMNSIPGLSGRTEDMIRAIADHFVGPVFGKIISVCIGLLLISACNTAITGIISVLFLMSKDKELPPIFSDLNRYGMPWFSLFIATAAPILVLLFENKVANLAALYAIGVVGAITINLIATSTNFKLGIKRYERMILGAVAAVMICVEVTIIAEKRNALLFASCVILVGLSARYIGRWIEKIRVVVPEVLGVNVLTLEEAKDLMPLYKGSTLVAVKALNPSLIEEASFHAKGRGEKVVYTIFVEEKPPGWGYPTEVEPSKEAVHVLNNAVEEFEKKGVTAVPLWNLGDDAGALIVKTSGELGLDTVMIGATKRGALERLLRGEVLKTISEQLPTDKRLVICN